MYGLMPFSKLSLVGRSFEKQDCQYDAISGHCELIYSALSRLEAREITKRFERREKTQKNSIPAL